MVETHERTSRRTLVLFGVLLCGLLCIVWVVLRGASSRRPVARLAEDVAPDVERPPAATDSPAEETSRVPLEQARTPAPESARSLETSAGVSGRLIIDGVVPEHGNLHLRTPDGKWERAAVLDGTGRFRLDSVPAETLVLSIELPATGEQDRKLLLPRIDVHARPGETEELDLAWTTKHVNLRVLSDAPEGTRTVVEVDGPGYDTSFETGADGKALLGLVGNGTFTFRAVQGSERRGEAVLELDEDSDLDSVLIDATQSR